MTPVILGAIIILFAVVVAIAVTATVRSAQAAAHQRVGIAYVKGLATRFTYREDLDPLMMEAAMTTALNLLSRIWPPVEINAILDGVFVNVLDVDDWVEPITRRNVAGVATPGTNSVTVDRKLKALAHELAHVLEAGRGRIVPRVEHDNWDERGIYNVLGEYELWLKERA